MGAKTKITIIPSSEFLTCSTRGEYDLERTRTHFLKLLRAAADAGAENILLDAREAITRMRAFEVFSLIEVFDELTPPFTGRLAILNQPKDAFNRAEFFSLCARHRGFEVDAFQDYQAAVEWLYPPQPLDTQIIRRADVEPK